MAQQRGTMEAKDKLFSILKAGCVVNKWKKLMKKSKIRYYSLNQLVTTQSNYLQDLRLIKEKMQIPLRQSGLIDEQKQNKIFSSLDGLIHLSVNLLQDCSKIKQQWNLHTSMLGPTMIYYSKFLLVYSEFLKAYKSNLDDLLFLVQNYQIAREIQDKISSQEGKVLTFQNLWSKPFQRTMKYKLILKQYHENLYINHPDYSHLIKAISKYEQVSQRNNQSLEQKQKNKTLMHLESKYGQIINEEAKNYIDCVSATMIDIKVKCYIFSNMLMVVNVEQKNEVQLMRIIINQTSFVTILKDIHYFKNRLFICGKRGSIHLTFDTKQSLNHCYECLKTIIYQLYLAQYTRRELSKKEGFSTSRQTLSQVRISYTQLKQKLPLSPRFFVIGYVKRSFSYAKLKIYYIIKFVLPLGYENNSILYVEQQKLLTLERIMRNLYENQLKSIPIIENPSKNISSNQIKGIDTKALQYKSINTTIFLNYIFRDRQILKRIDIAAHLLTINEPMWIFCKYINQKCSCSLCVNGQVLNKIADYEEQIYDRNKNRIFKFTFYCPFRTFHSQNMIAQIKKQSITNSIDRFFLLKCQKHELDYRIADSPPLYIMKKQIQISFDKLQPLIKLQLIIDHQQRIGQIISTLQQLYRIRLDDHQMVMTIHTKSYLLGRDQILWNILAQKAQQQQSRFLSFFRTTFRQKQDLNIKLYLKKIWILQPQYQKVNGKQDKKIMNLIQQFMVRITRRQITLQINQLATFYATYFVLKTIDNKQHQQVSNQNLKLILLQKWNVLEKKHKATILQAITQKVYFLRNKNYKKEELILRIWDYINIIGQKRPGWSAFMFTAEIVNFPGISKESKVSVGADLYKFYVKSQQTINILYECLLQQTLSKVLISGFQLRIKQKNETYIISGDDLFNLQNIIDTYLLYKKIF